MNDFCVGVPYSGCDKDLPEDYIIATREDEAIGIAVGAWLAGKTPLVFMQNSGIGNSVDIITSLLLPYNINIDIRVADRSSPYHHYFMHRLLRPLMELLKYDTITDHKENI